MEIFLATTFSVCRGPQDTSSAFHRALTITVGNELA